MVANDETIVSATTVAGAPATLDAYIEHSSEDVKSGLAKAESSGGGISQSDVEWMPPVRRPGKVMGVAINNKMGQQIAYRPFADPAFFFKPVSCLIGHGAPVVVKASYGVTHPEPELAVVIGRRAKEVSESAALQHVFGYTVINDVTSPGLKEKDSIELVAPTPGGGGAYGKLLGWRRVFDEDLSLIHI